MIEIILITIIGFLLIVIGVVWANGIDYMQKNHPDYKGDDFLN